jgi:RHS repeat-associated protein
MLSIALLLAAVSTPPATPPKGWQVRVSMSNWNPEPARCTFTFESGETRIEEIPASREVVIPRFAVLRNPEATKVDCTQPVNVKFRNSPYEDPPPVRPTSSRPRGVRDPFISSFKGAPFTEPMTGYVYMRNRWFDPRTGTFLTPDPARYLDSSNMYAYCGGDPVNCTDPTGKAGYFFDGTNNDSRKMKNPTNVAKLRKKYLEEIFYWEGVGSNVLNFIPGGLTGFGGQFRLDSMYHDLSRQYNAGDRNIDIFGFSRGAALAIAFANLIGEKGIPDFSSARTEVIPGRDGTANEVVRYSRYFRPRIRFLGIFDAVGSFGAPGGCINLGYNLNAPSNVDYVRHATSADEVRILFPLSSMYTREGRTNGNVIEKSFPGVHSDIGGGYDDNDELSRGPLAWMASEARQAGVPIGSFTPEELAVSPSATPHDSRMLMDKVAQLANRAVGGQLRRTVCHSHLP